MQLLRESKQTLYIATAVAMVIVIVYFMRGVLNGETLSLEAVYWLEFAEFVGLLLAPIAGLTAAILLCQQLSLSSKVTQLETLERTCTRLDGEVQRLINLPLRNRGFKHSGLPLIEVVYAYDNSGEVAPDELRDALNCLLQNISAVLEIAAWNRLLLKRYEEAMGDYHWLAHSDRLYWTSRYNPMLSRMYKVIGKAKIEAKLTERQMEVCAELTSEFARETSHD